VNGDRFTRSIYNVWCNGCLSRFKINLNTGQNCKVQGGKKEAQVSHMLFDADLTKWSVRTDHCKGFLYDLKGLGTLVRTGLISSLTPIRPPGSGKSYKAGELAQLHVFFTEKNERAKRAHPQATHAAPKEDETDRSWKDMDVSELFKSVLKKDLFARS